jgi:hypothetical protein
VEAGYSIGDNGQGVVVEDLRNLVSVMLNLVVGILNGRLIRIGVFQLEQDEGQAVDVNKDVWAAVVLTVDRQLVDNLELVLLRPIPVDGVDVPMLLAATG